MPDDANSHLFEALEILNDKLKQNHIEKLDLKICGGFATAQWTSRRTRDIDSTQYLAEDIKEIVEEIADEEYELDLDDDWLNDDWAKFSSKTELSGIVDENIIWETKPLIDMERISVTCVTFDSLIAMKYIAYEERGNDKDLEDLTQLYHAENLTIDDFLAIMKSHGVTDQEDHADIISELYANKLIGEKEYEQWFKYNRSF